MTLELEVWQIFTVAIPILALLLGTGWHLLKRIPKETAEVLIAIGDAIEDNKITRAELVRMVEEWSNLQRLTLQIAKQFGWIIKWLKL